MKMQEKYPKTVFFCIGLLWGVALTFSAGIFYLRSSLIREMPSKLSYENAVKQFPENAAKIPGWTIRSQKCGLPTSKISVFEICSRTYASELLATDPQLGSIIPCKIAIYEKADGKTYIATLNNNLFMRLVGGNPAEIFTNKIIPEQRRMLNGIVQE